MSLYHFFCSILGAYLIFGIPFLGKAFCQNSQSDGRLRIVVNERETVYISTTQGNIKSIEFRTSHEKLLVKNSRNGRRVFGQSIFLRGREVAIWRDSSSDLRVSVAQNIRYQSGALSAAEQAELEPQFGKSEIGEVENCEIHPGGRLDFFRASPNLIGPSCDRPEFGPNLREKINSRLLSILKIERECGFGGQDLTEGIKDLGTAFNELTSKNRYPVDCTSLGKSSTVLESGEIHLEIPQGENLELAADYLTKKLRHEIAHQVIYRRCSSFLATSKGDAENFFGLRAENIPSCSSLKDESLANQASDALKLCAEQKNRGGEKVSSLAALRGEALELNPDNPQATIPIAQVATAAEIQGQAKALAAVGAAMNGDGPNGADAKVLVAAATLGQQAPGNPFGVPKATVVAAAERIGNLVKGAGFSGSVIRGVTSLFGGSLEKANADTKAGTLASGGSSARSPAAADSNDMGFQVNLGNVNGPKYQTPRADRSILGPGGEDENSSAGAASADRKTSIRNEKLAVSRLGDQRREPTSFDGEVVPPDSKKARERDSVAAGAVESSARSNSGNGMGAGGGGSAGGPGQERGPASKGDEGGRKPSAYNGKSFSDEDARKFETAVKNRRNLKLSKMKSKNQGKGAGDANLNSTGEYEKFLSWAKSVEGELKSDGVQITYFEEGESKWLGTQRQPKFKYIIRCIGDSSCDLTSLAKKP